MRTLIVTSLALVLAACSTPTQVEHPQPANLQWYEGAWQSEDGTARQVLTETTRGYRGALFFLQDGDWVQVSQGQCIRREIPIDGWYVRAPVWDCDYYPDNGADMGFDRLSQSAYTANSFQIPGGPAFGDGSIFVNRAWQGEDETVTYEHWTRPAGDRFSYRLWRTGEGGTLEPWFSGTWVRIAEAD